MRWLELNLNIIYLSLLFLLSSLLFIGCSQEKKLLTQEDNNISNDNLGKLLVEVIISPFTDEVKSIVAKERSSLNKNCKRVMF